VGAGIRTVCVCCGRWLYCMLCTYSFCGFEEAVWRLGMYECVHLRRYHQSLAEVTWGRLYPSFTRDVATYSQISSASERKLRTYRNQKISIPSSEVRSNVGAERNTMFDTTEGGSEACLKMGFQIATSTSHWILDNTLLAMM
jgi:hypothetical protein